LSLLLEEELREIMRRAKSNKGFESAFIRDDGLEDLKDVLIVGATNRPDLLDPLYLDQEDLTEFF
jgi:SpoVK/Ycf46/Vps4 family AAA+-type ATPase